MTNNIELPRFQLCAYEYTRMHRIPIRICRSSMARQDRPDGSGIDDDDDQIVGQIGQRRISLNSSLPEADPAEP